MAPQIDDPLLPAGSLVLVTGANGLIATHIVDQLLTYGYSVRGAVRSISRCSWMPTLFAQRHPNAPFSLVEVPDISVPGAFDAALKGVSAMIHTASSTSFSADPAIITDAINSDVNALEAVASANKNGGKIQRVVITSSSWAVTYPHPNTKKVYDWDTYDTSAEKYIKNEGLPDAVRGLYTYVLSKKEAEVASWKWWDEHKSTCGFVLNTTLPGTCMGPVLAPEQQPYATTAGFVRSMYEGKNEQVWSFLEPQWHLDLRDAARLHVAGVVLKGVEGKRLFGFAEKFTWPQIAEIMEKRFGRKVPIMPGDRGVDETEIGEPRDYAEGCLKRLGRAGWTGLEESVVENVKSFYPDAGA